MRLLEKLFGKWEKESERSVVATYSSIFKSLYGEREMLLVVEKNTKSGKKRAHIKDVFGNRTDVDIDYVERTTK